MKLRSYLTATLAVLALASCSKHDAPAPLDPGDRIAVSAVFPGIERDAGSKGAYDDGRQNNAETSVGSVDAYLFDSSTGILLATASGTAGQGSADYRFTLARTMIGKDVKIVFVANDNLDQDLIEVETTTYTEFQSLQTAAVGGSLSGPFVMMAEAGLILAEGADNSVGALGLKRLAARIDITNATGDDESVITGARIINGAKYSPIHPDGTCCDQFITECTLLSNTGYCTDLGKPGIETADGCLMWSHLYAYANDNTGSDKTAIELHYTYKGVAESAVIDFVDEDGDDMAVKRNYRYEIVISDLAMKPVFEVKVTPWNIGQTDEVDIQPKIFTVTEADLGIATYREDTLWISHLQQAMSFTVESDSPVTAEAFDYVGNPVQWITIDNGVVATRTVAQPVKGGYTGTVTINAKRNAENTDRGAVRVRLSNQQGSWNVWVVQLRESANCYILRPGQRLTFNGSIRGNEGIPTMTDAHSISTYEYWTDTPGLVSCGSTPSKHLFNITANPGKTGNVIIAKYVPAEEGLGYPAKKLYWSWHIWVTDYAPERAVVTGYGPNQSWPTTGGEVHTYGASFVAANPGKVIMDRNLGATGAYYTAPADGTSAAALKALGLTWQWGRKDPFLGWDGTPAGGFRLIATFADGQNSYLDIAPVVIPDIDLTAPFTEGVSIDTAAAYPARFGFNGPWWDASVNPSELWVGRADGGKSIYDPCPPGWRMPDAATFGDITAATTTYYANGSATPSGEVRNATAGRFYNQGAAKVWFPITGVREATAITAPGEESIYWTASRDGSGARGYRINATGLSWGGGDVASAGAIRCVQE